MSIKLIASDLDGTLLTDAKTISKATREALQAAAERGIQFVPATGRAYASVPREIRELPGAEYMITSNGAALYSLSRGKRIYECCLTPEMVDAVISAEMPDGMVLEIFIEGEPWSDWRYVEDPRAYGATDFGAVYVKQTRRGTKDLRRLAAENRTRIDSVTFVGGTEKSREEFRRRLLADIPDISITSAVSHLLEVGHREAGKGNTLGKLLELLDIRPEEVMCFGDADNDISMLTAVKYGVAMGNGTPDCREAAFAVTDTNERDGAAKAILSYLRCEAGQEEEWNFSMN